MNLQERFKYHWLENVKPFIGVMIIGVALILGMRIMEMAWPATAQKVFICFSSDTGKVEQCKAFADRNEEIKEN